MVQNELILSKSHTLQVFHPISNCINSTVTFFLKFHLASPAYLGKHKGIFTEPSNRPPFHERLFDLETQTSSNNEKLYLFACISFILLHCCPT